MRDFRLLIATLCVVLVSVCSSSSQSFNGSDYDEPIRMASESLVVKSYKDAETSTVSTTTSLGDRLEEYQVYQGVMGRPGIDFPVYPYIPATNFNCRGVKKSGYYADLATDCQVFHICDGNRKISFLCPNGTIFRQSHLICDWWFRVDCGKSVDLYEESAEQLAADQKIYKARSEEREKKRKQGKALSIDNGGELTSSEVYALDEPFQLKGRKQTVQNRNNVQSTSARVSSVRYEGRKGERNSKKVADSGSTEKFQSYNRDRQTGRVVEKNKLSKDRQTDARQYSTAAPKVSFVDNREFTVTTPIPSTSAHKTRYQTQNSINIDNNKENIQLAESGSLIDELHNRNQNFLYNRQSNQSSVIDNTFNFKRIEGQTVDLNSRGQNTGTTYTENKRTDEINSATSKKQVEDQTTDINSRGRNINFVENDKKRTQTTVDFNNNPLAYNSKTTGQATEINRNRGNDNFGYSTNSAQQANFNGERNNNNNNNFAYNIRAGQQTGNGTNGNVNTNDFAYNTRTQQLSELNGNRGNNNFGYNTNVAQQSANFNGGTSNNNNFAYNIRVGQETANVTNGNLNNNNWAFNTGASQQTTELNGNRGNNNFAFGINAGQQSANFNGGRNSNNNFAFSLRAGQETANVTNENLNSNNFTYNTRTAQQSDFNPSSNINFAYNARTTKQLTNFNSGKSNNNVGNNVRTGQQSANLTNANVNSNTFAYNTRTEQVSTNFTNRSIDNNFSYNVRTSQQTPKFNEDISNTNFAHNTRTKQQSAADTNNAGRNDNFFYNSNKESNSQFNYNENQKTDQTDSSRNRNNNFAYSSRTVEQSDYLRNGNGNVNNNLAFSTTTESVKTPNFDNSGRNGKVNFIYTTKNTENTQSGGRNNDFNENNKEQAENVDVTDYTTEFVNYESKRTNPVERYESGTPLAFSRNTQSAKYRSSTVPYVEEERQYFAETASFASNRGGKSFSDFQNQFNTFSNKNVATTTGNYKTTFYQTPKPSDGFSSTQAPLQKFNSPTFNQNFNQVTTSWSEFYRTTTQRPIKQNSRKVTFYPSTNQQTTVTNRVWQTTTFQPYFETTTANDKFTAEDVYFTTSTPDKNAEIVTENQDFEVSQKQTEFQTGFDFITSTPMPEVDITLQELNINKGFIQGSTTKKSYEDFVREGLEVPPSSGPNALRSFALYFATTRNRNVEEGKTTVFQPLGETDVSPTLTPFELKKKAVVQQVDELVQKSSLNVTDHDFASSNDSLPNSLTPNTQNSYSALFAGSSENRTTFDAPDVQTEFETTAFESFTEEPHRINKELTKNDLDGSQSRGLVEPDPHSDTDYSKVSPDLRELAQVFTKALSAYLDDPEAFRRVLSEIRPTEPTIDTEVSSSNPLEYPSATQEDDEVLDFSDVTKASYKKKTSTIENFRETTTEHLTDVPTTRANDIENFVLPLNHTSWATNIELTAPLFESLDQSQSSYYTPPPFIGTTNAIAEEINNEFKGNEKLPPGDSNEAVDSYLPIRGSVDDPSLPRYGGFQNNTGPTTKYSPYGAELTSTTYLPYGADLTTTLTPNTAASANDAKATTFNPNNVTSFFSHFSKNESKEGEAQLAEELNNLVLLQKFTTPRGNQKETTTPEPNLSTAFLSTQNEVQFQDVQLGNGETIEKNTRGGKALHFPESDVNSNNFEPNPKEINLELSPPSSTPKGFLITYSLGSSFSSEPATYLPKVTTPEVLPTTYAPGRTTIFNTQGFTAGVSFDSFPDSSSRSSSEYFTTVPPTTPSFAKSTKSVERIAQLQETLMFNTTNLTVQQKDQARITVEEMMGTLNMTDSTANTLMKMMEMAAKNETYRRLVLLLVNDKSGKNKTVEESRLSLLKALLTPVINPHQTRTVLPIPETSRLEESDSETQTNLRRSKSINSDVSDKLITTTPGVTTQKKISNGKTRRVKTNRGLARAESNYSKSGLGNLGLIRRTIENSKNKQVRINSLDDAILDSDSRAVELLRSLYSLAARWG